MTNFPPRLVWTQVGRDKLMRCDLGCTHTVGTWASKYIMDTGTTYPYNNGYSIDPARVYIDRQGRLYQSQPPTDFSGSTSYIRVVDRVRFSGRPHMRPALDVLGRVIEV